MTDPKKKKKGGGGKEMCCPNFLVLVLMPSCILRINVAEKST